MEAATTKNCTVCGNEFTPHRNHPNQQYCSDRCARTFRKRKQAELFSNQASNTNRAATVDDDAPIKRTPVATPITATTDILTKTILDFKEKEIQRMEAAYNEERNKRKKLKAENETLRTELAEIKTAQRIAEIENAKPTGLNGILPGGIEGLLNNQYIGPVLAGLLDSVFKKPGGLEGQSAANGFIVWFDQQTDDVKQSFAELVDGLSKADPSTLADTIKRMVALLNVGTTMGNPTEFKQTAAYGY